MTERDVVGASVALASKIKPYSMKKMSCNCVRKTSTSSVDWRVTSDFGLSEPLRWKSSTCGHDVRSIM
ncbi:hypothetical protein NQZ68_010723 [Dissostichus eleginoides]|nr:hypothetical protein NQZ68_010723 [Dissostichus eleginoides]